MRLRAGKGFTIAEVMAVAGIFAILATIILADLRSGGRIQILQASADEMASRIKQAQDLAYSSAKQLICSTDGKVCKSGSTCDASYPTNCSMQYVTQYGIALSVGTSNKYMVGADYGNLGTYTTGEAVPNGLVTLPANIVIDSVTPNIVSPNYNLVFKYNATSASPFVPCSSNCTTTIVLKDNVSNVTRSVIYRTQTGLVSVE
jgi:prepilin-type N-terminal cleavage/methylation domain-containing protein